MKFKKKEIDEELEFTRKEENEIRKGIEELMTAFFKIYKIGFKVGLKGRKKLMNLGRSYGLSQKEVVEFVKEGLK